MILHTDTEWPPRRCSGESCKQGRADCQTPEACQLPESAERMLSRYLDLLVSVVLVAACFGVVALVAVIA